MFKKHDESGYQRVDEGVERQTLVHGDRTMMVEMRLKKGAAPPRHSHPHEQTGYLVKGRLRFSIGDHVYDVQSGDSWCIPGGMEHSAEAIEDTVVIEVFSPVREEYLIRPR